MSSVIDKIKHYIEIWKIEKYTRRRTFMPEYDAKGIAPTRHHYFPCLLTEVLKIKSITTGITKTEYTIPATIRLLLLLLNIAVPYEPFKELRP